MSDAIKQSLTLEMLRAKRNDILNLAARYGAFNVRVFGSLARGEPTPESDVDFLVNFRDEASLYDLSGLRLDLAELLGCPVDLVEEHPRMNERFKKRILHDIVPL